MFSFFLLLIYIFYILPRFPTANCLRPIIRTIGGTTTKLSATKGVDKLFFFVCVISSHVTL